MSDVDLHQIVWDRLADGAIDGIPGLQVGATRLMLRAVRPRSIAELADALALSPANTEKQRNDYLQFRTVNGPLAGLLANEPTAAILAPTRGVLLYTDQADALVGALTGWNADQVDRLVRAYDQADLHTLAAIGPDFRAAASKRLSPETVRALTSHLFYGVYRSQSRQDWLTAAQDVFDAACRVVSGTQPSADRYTNGVLDLDRAQAQALRDSLDSWLNGQVG